LGKFSSTKRLWTLFLLSWRGPHLVFLEPSWDSSLTQVAYGATRAQDPDTEGPLLRWGAATQKSSHNGTSFLDLSSKLKRSAMLSGAGMLGHRKPPFKAEREKGPKRRSPQISVRKSFNPLKKRFPQRGLKSRLSTLRGGSDIPFRDLRNWLIVLFEGPTPLVLESRIPPALEDCLNPPPSRLRRIKAPGMVRGIESFSPNSTGNDNRFFNSSELPVQVRGRRLLNPPIVPNSQRKARGWYIQNSPRANAPVLFDSPDPKLLGYGFLQPTRPPPPFGLPLDHLNFQHPPQPPSSTQAGPISQNFILPLEPIFHSGPSRPLLFQLGDSRRRYLEGRSPLSTLLFF